MTFSSVHMAGKFICQSPFNQGLCPGPQWGLWLPPDPACFLPPVKSSPPVFFIFASILLYNLPCKAVIHGDPMSQLFYGIMQWKPCSTVISETKKTCFYPAVKKEITYFTIIFAYPIQNLCLSFFTMCFIA